MNLGANPAVEVASAVSSYNRPVPAKASPAVVQKPKAPSSSATSISKLPERDRKKTVKYEGHGFSTASLKLEEAHAAGTAPAPAHATGKLGKPKKTGPKPKPSGGSGGAGFAGSSSSSSSSAPQQGIVGIVSYMQSEPQPKKAVWVPPSVALSERDRAKQLLLSADQMEVTGVNGGYRMIRATHGVHNGAYFWEIEILPPVDAPGVDASLCHTRVGWSTRQGQLEAPVGNDKHGFGFRDVSGSKVHGGERVDHYGAEFGPGDIIGCFLYLDVDDVGNNQMRFFKNGHDQGVAYRGREIPLGVYFPAVSVYMQARILVNFGPSFLLKHDIFGANAVSEVQPMNPEDRKAHDARIASIRATNPACLALKAQGGSAGGVSL